MVPESQFWLSKSGWACVEVCKLPACSLQRCHWSLVTAAAAEAFSVIPINQSHDRPGLRSLDHEHAARTIVLILDS